MFVKAKHTETAFTAARPAVPLPQSTVPQRAVLPTGAPRNGSIISADVVIRGTLFSTGDVQIDGKLEGDIRASGLVVGEKAIITGDVHAEEATIRGCVEGDISARRTQLCSTCHVEGNLLNEALSVEMGAFFEGNCHHSKDPLANATENVATVERKSSAPLHSIVEPHRPQASAAQSQPHPSQPLFDRW